jgi:hypothetical protein
MSETVAATSSAPIGKIDWNDYYAECHKFVLYQSQKFTNLLSQASVFALAVCTAIVTIAENFTLDIPRTYWWPRRL